MTAIVKGFRPLIDMHGKIGDQQSSHLNRGSAIAAVAPRLVLTVDEVEERLAFIHAKPFCVDVGQDFGMRHETADKTRLAEMLYDIRPEQTDVIVLRVEEKAVFRRLQQRIGERAAQARGVRRLADRPPAGLENAMHL